MKPVLILKYKVENDSMTDEEFYSQEERQLIVTEEMIEDLIKNADRNLNRGDYILYENVYLNKI